MRFIPCIICLFITSLLSAQPNRYKQAIFSSRDLQSNVQYGSADSYDVFGFNSPQPQRLDFYEPSGDTATKRPLVLVFYGGGYLIGSKIMQDMVGWCDSLTAYGYACAAVNYRLGFNVLRTGSAIRAGYRGLQDARAAIRFFKEFHQQYKIDTSLIFVGGNSAGAMIALQTAYGEESDRPAATYGISGTLDDDDDLGCLDCSGNNYQHSVDIAGVISCWGGVIDLEGLDATDQSPVIMFHGEEDAVVPIDSGLAFSGNGAFPLVYGSRAIHNERQNLGLLSELYVYPDENHNFYYDGAFFPSNYWDTLWNLSHPFLCAHNPYCQQNVSVTDLGFEDQKIQIAPNPVRNYLNVDFNSISENTFYEIIDGVGRRVKTGKIIVNHQGLDVSVLPSGRYFIKIVSDDLVYATSFVKLE